MLVKVTQEHIERGRRCTCVGCPVALAMIDAGLLNVWVGFDSMSFRKGDGLLEQRHTSLAVKRFINSYDKRDPVQPFEFALEMSR